MRVGIVAGSGNLPKVFKKILEERGHEVVLVGFKGISDGCNYLLNLKEPLEVLKVFKEEGLEGVVLLGKFEQRLSFEKFTKEFLGEGSDLRPESIIREVLKVFEREGIKPLDPRPILEPLLAKEGSMNGLKLDEKTLKEGSFGFKVAKFLANNDIGQTVVLKDGVVVALEGVEGTQKTLERAYSLVGEGTVVVKVGRSNQDFKIDPPVVGLETLKTLKEMKAKALFLEAGKVIIVEKEKFLRDSRELGIPVLGLKEKN